MKLLRVVSKENDLTSFFSNEFSEAIEIPPHSKVALINALFNIDSKSIYIPTDSVFTFTLKNGGDDVTVSIPSGYYTSQSIVSSVEEKLNTAIDKTTQLSGGNLENVQFLWRPSVGKSPGLLSLSFARQKQVVFDFPDDNLKFITLDAGTFTSSKLSGSAGQFEAFGYSNTTVIPCATTITMKVGGQDQKFIMGLLKAKRNLPVQRRILLQLILCMGAGVMGLMFITLSTGLKLTVHLLAQSTLRLLSISLSIMVRLSLIPINTNKQLITTLRGSSWLRVFSQLVRRFLPLGSTPTHSIRALKTD